MNKACGLPQQQQQVPCLSAELLPVTSLLSSCAYSATQVDNVAHLHTVFDAGERSWLTWMRDPGADSGSLFAEEELCWHQQQEELDVGCMPA